MVGEGLTVYLADDAQAWTLDADGTYTRVPRRGEEHVCAQELLMQRLGGAATDDGA